MSESDAGGARQASGPRERRAIASVRYLVDDVAEAMDFYTIQLGFTAVLDGAPDFAHLELGDLRLLLNGPASSAARPTPLGRPAPGGWNRIQLVVDDLASKVAALRCAGHAPVDEVTVGRGGSQVLLRDPSGNLIELFAPAAS